MQTQSFVFQGGIDPRSLASIAQDITKLVGVGIECYWSSFAHLFTQRKQDMHTQIKHIFWATCLLICYPLYSIGQLWIFQSQRDQPDLYTSLSSDASPWVNAHILLILGIMSMIPAYLAISHYVRETKAKSWLDWSTLFLCLGTFVLFGQFTIDLIIPPVFSSTKDQGYTVLEQMQENPVVKALFYDNSQLFILFKFLDLNLLAQICLAVGLVLSKKLPKWALAVFFIALLATQLGMVLGPVYGRIIKRSGYALFSVSFLPIAWFYLKAGLSRAFSKEAAV
jgi:putative Mn2+ efflux pump MntP